MAQPPAGEDEEEQKLDSHELGLDGRRSLESETMLALLSHPASSKSPNPQLHRVLRKFAELLKSNFENSSLWLRYGLVLALTRVAPQSAVEAFNECSRIDPRDPLPTMLAAKLLLLELDDPEAGLRLATEAIGRCKEALAIAPSTSNHRLTNGDGEQPKQNGHSSESLETKTILQSEGSQPLRGGSGSRDIPQLLSKCYLLASIMNAYIYEREPESIKLLKLDNLKASMAHLELAATTCATNHLTYFHRALHHVRDKSFTAAIENTRQAIKLNPQHLPSMQLLILALSALKLYDKALILCESTLQEFEDNLLLLYIKCNLEQNLVKLRGYKSALATAQYMLKCIRRSSSSSYSSTSSTTSSTLITTTTSNNNNNNNNNHHHHPPQQSNSHTTSTSASNPASPGGATLTAASIQQHPLNTTNIPKQSSGNLFSENSSSCIYRRGRQTELFQSELQVWLLVAEIFIRIGSIADAELCVDEASKHLEAPLSYQVMFVWGLISKAKNNLIEAKSFFQSCLALCPRHAKALQEIAHVHYLLGNHSTAEKFLRDSLDEDSECDKAWYYLSLVFIETNQHERAKEASNRAQQLEDSAPVVPFSTISRLTLE